MTDVLEIPCLITDITEGSRSWKTMKRTSEDAIRLEGWWNLRFGSAWEQIKTNTGGSKVEHWAHRIVLSDKMWERNRSPPFSLMKGIRKATGTEARKSGILSFVSRLVQSAQHWRMLWTFRIPRDLSDGKSHCSISRAVHDPAFHDPGFALGQKSVNPIPFLEMASYS